MLTPKQAQRLDQITIQAMKIWVVGDAKIASVLNISDAQKQRLEQIQADFSKARSQLSTMLREKKIDRKQYSAEQAKLREKLEAAMEGVLSAEQQAELKKLRGTAFEFGNLLNTS